MTRWCITLLFLAWGPVVTAAEFDRSDLNNDGVVDIADIDIFSDRYLALEPSASDVCTFVESSVLNEKYFRRITSDNIARYETLISVMTDSNDCQFASATTSATTSAKTSSTTAAATTNSKSDLDADGDVDIDDLALFSTIYLETPWENVDWCLFHGATLAGADFNGTSTKYFLRHFGDLLNFINNHFNCGGEEPPPDNLAVENVPKFLARIADATAFSGDHYITDPRVGSVFVYDELMALTGEIKGLNKPLGVAVDMQGRILVGNDGRDNIEAYDPATGDLVAVFGEGLVQMPTAITVDIAGNIYVVDSRSNQVHVFDPSYFLLRSIGRGGIGDDTLNFPMDAEVIGQEVFVADQEGDRVQVYQLDGTWVRSLTFEGTDGVNCSWFTGVCEIPGMPPFTRLQALAVDSLNRLHVLDNFAASVIIFDPADGTMINAYGAYGAGAGELRVPMDVQISATDMATVTSGDGSRIEFFTVPQ